MKKDSALRTTFLQKPSQGIGKFLLFGIAVTVLFSLFYIYKPFFFQTLDLRIFDTFQQQNLQDKPDPDIAIIDIDEKSLERHGQWPWPRYRVARLFQRIQELGALVVAIDMVFPEADHTSLNSVQRDIERELGQAVFLGSTPAEIRDNDKALAETLRKGPFVLGYEFSFAKEKMTAGDCLLHPTTVAVIGVPETGISNIPLYKADGVICNLRQFCAAVTTSGFFNTFIDADGILRRIPLIIQYNDGKNGNRYYPSLVLATLMRVRNINQAFLRIDSGKPSEIIFGKFKVPVDAEGNLMIRYLRKGKTFPYVSAADILSGLVPRERIEGKIVFVGTTAMGLGERRATSTDPFLPGVEVHATIAHNILQQNFILRPWWISGVELFLIIVMGILSTLVLIRSGAAWSLFMLIAVTLGLWVVSGWLFHAKGIFLSPLIPIITVGANFSFLTPLKFWREEQTVRERTRELVRTQDFTIVCLATLTETRDKETGGHIFRCQSYVRTIAEQLETRPAFKDLLNEETIDLLIKSCSLHDIGKIGIPDWLLFKSGELSDEEYNQLKKHTQYGRDAIERAEQREARFGKDRHIPFLTLAKEIAYSHHEHWDGSGYPEGLAGEEIPLSARIMAVADVYDALITARVYKTKVSHEEAVDFISQNKGIIFDPCIVDAFLEIHEEFQRISHEFPD